MSVEQSIRKMLLEREQTMNDPASQQLDQNDPGASAAALQQRADYPLSNMDNGDRTQPKQGNSQDNPADPLNPTDPGEDASRKQGQMAPLATVGDAQSVRVQSMEGKTVEITLAAIQEALKSTQSKPVSKETLKEDISALFAGQEGLAEGFVEKATSLFEAAVVGRVNAEMITVTQKLEEQSNQELTKLSNTLTEQANKYLTEMVNTWGAENKLALDRGLKQEIAEGFMNGIKDLFVEYYIDVPTDKVDVLESLTADLEASKERINEEVNNKLAIQQELTDLKKVSVIAEQSKGMTDTDADRLKSLVEGIEFDNQELFAEKVAVIKEQHFKKTAKKSAEIILAEQTGENEPEQINASVQRYVNALNRGAKF
jgi:hypothetical protein